MAPSLSSLAKRVAWLKSWQAGAAFTVVVVLTILYKLSIGQSSSFSGATLTEFGDARMPHYSPLTISFINSVWPLVLFGVLLSLLAYRIGSTFWRVSATVRKQAAVADDKEGGAGAVEFVMITPVLAVLLLMILQIALIVQAKFVVNYAAFCAARSAIVVIPDIVGRLEPRNRLINPDRSNKIDVIQRAAALPVTAISPPPGVSLARGLPVITNPNAIVDLAKLAPFDVTPRSMMGQVMLRAPYAYDERNTAVKVLGGEGGSFKDHDWVTVKVQYRYYLTVPFAQKLFGTAYSGNRWVNLLLGADYYYPIVEQYTLPMDGEPSGL